MNWVLPKVSEEGARALAAELSLHPLAARVLIARGFNTASEAAAFLSDKLQDLPDPHTMKGMPEAVARVFRALRAGEKITLWGDYDVDGVCSTALLSLFLKSLGANVATYIPHRLEEGYGLNAKAIERIAQDGSRLLVTLDCGITSFAEITKANELGLDVVVVDHHTVPEVMPPAVAVLNPHQPGCNYPTKHLCAAGVTFNLCMGLRKMLRESGFFAGKQEPNLREYLDLVALATVADVVPLTGANRILVKHGLKELTAARRIGVKALKDAAGLLPGTPVTAGHVGFRLGPRINAAGRLSDASVGLRLLTSQSVTEAAALAKDLDAANAERQQIEQEILNQALAMAEARKSAKGFVLYGEGWHPGVVGIVASRVVEKYHRPTAVIGVQDGVGKGSARSIEAFHLYDALKECASHLARFGGHKHAAGLTVESAQLPAFTEAFERIAAARLSDADMVARCRIDAVVSPSELTEAAVTAIQALAPFGKDNPEPVFASRNVTAFPRVLQNKREGAVGHLKLSLESAPALDCIGFQMADKLALTEGPLELAFQVGIDEFRGNRRVSLKLKDLRSA